MEDWEQTLDVELGDVAPRVPHTQPVNMVEQSKIYTLGPDGTKHYIKDDDQFLYETAIPADSVKPIVVDSDARKLLVKPTGTFLDMVVIEVARLNKPLPYKAQPAAWAEAQLVMDELFVQPLKDEKGVFRALTPDELITYIYQRPWTESHKEETVQQIRKWKTGQKLKGPVKVTPKKDEIIPNQPTLAADGGVATKTRPITPKADADVPGMSVAVPLKYYVGGTRRWAVSGSDPTFMPTKDPIPGVFTFSTTYVPNPRSDSLGKWITENCKIWGLHIIMHGDDHYALYVCRNGQWRACALDMVSCDLTCAELFQRAFMWFVNELSDHATDDIMDLQFRNLTGRFELKHNDPRVKERMFVDKNEPTTNTGEGLTSLKAWFGQQSAGFSVVKACWVNGDFDPRRYKTAVQTVWRQLGFIPEFEEDEKGNVWHDVSACTFLGGFFVPQVMQGSQEFYWCPNKVLKSYFTFPDVNAIYGDKFPLQKHMLVLTSDPDMDISPVTRELKSWYKRCAQAAFGDAYWDMYSEALKKFTSYYRHFDPYVAEQWQQKKGLVVTPLSDLSFYPAADRLCVRNGWAPGRGAGELQSLVGEIQKFGTSPFEKLSHSAMALYVMRFGPPKADPNSAEKHKPLSVLDAMGALALKIYQSMRPKGLPRKEWNAMSAKQKAKMAARFLDFNIHTTSVNSGSQQYGAGLKLTGNSGGDSHSAGGSPMTTSGPTMGPRSVRRYNGVEIVPRVKTRAEVQPGLGPGKTGPVIPQREMIAVVKAPTSEFSKSNEFTIQPGLKLTEGSCFKFIVPLAQQYEKYNLEDLVVEYVPTVSAFAEAGRAGQVILTFVPDALTGPDETIEDALATNPHVSGQPNEYIKLKIPCREAMQGGKFMRTGPVPMADLKTYDAGKIFVYTSGVVPVDPGAAFGQIHVSYKVKLINPRPEGNATTVANLAYSRWANPGFTIPLSTTLAYATMPAFFGNSNPLGITLVDGPPGRSDAKGYKLPPGAYLVHVNARLNNDSVSRYCETCIWYSDDDGATWTANQTGICGTHVPLLAGSTAGASSTYPILAGRSTVVSFHVRYWNGAAAGANDLAVSIFITCA